MIENIVIIEPQDTENFYPFSILHCIWEMRCGMYKIYEKYEKLLPGANLAFIGRDLHLQSFLARYSYTNKLENLCNTLIIYANILPNKSLISEILNSIQNINSNIDFYHNDNLIAKFLVSFQNSNFEQLKIDENHKKIELHNTQIINYLWDTIDFNHNAINEDAEISVNHYNTIDKFNFPGVFFENPNKILIAENVDIKPGTYIDASHGYVVIDSNTTIMAQATILGPAYIGKNNTIKIGAKIYHDCSFGEFCKVGGELEASIIHSYSNKQHDGFLGHSYICEWVNLGADTNNSDLKNTYGEIRMRLRDKEVNTGKMFLGLMCGDHTKSGINSMFTTGTVAGICGILVREWFMPNYIPSFSWGGAKDSPIYKASKAIETAKQVMQRRKKQITDEEIRLIEQEYQKTQK